jgi:putative inorganic carbon (HCO3(-)) transporter
VAARLDWPRWAGAASLALVAAPVGLLAGVDPPLAIAAALALAFVLVTFTNLAAGLAVFSFIAFFEVIALPGAVVNIAKPAGLLLAISWFALVTTRRNAKLDFLSVYPVPSVVLGLFVSWALLSTAWSTDTGDALSSAGRYGLNVMLFLIVFTAVRTPRQLSWVLLAFVLGAAMTAVTGILSPTGEEEAGRLGSGALDPSELSAVLVSGVALSAAVVVLYQRSALVRVAAFIVGVFALVAVWLTASRGGLVALAAAIMAAVVLSGRWRALVLVVASMFAAVTVFYFAAFAPQNIRDRVTSPSQGQERIKEGRTTIWQVAWRAFEDNPVKGVGAGNFPVVSGQYLLRPGVLARTDEIIGETPKVVHNIYLEVAAELGLIGLGLFIWILGFAIWSMLAAARSFARAGDGRLQAVAICISVGVIGILAADVFISDQYSKELWLLMGLGPAMLHMARDRESMTLR